LKAGPGNASSPLTGAEEPPTPASRGASCNSRRTGLPAKLLNTPSIRAAYWEADPIELEAVGYAQRNHRLAGGEVGHLRRR